MRRHHAIGIGVARIANLREREKKVAKISSLEGGVGGGRFFIRRTLALIGRPLFCGQNKCDKKAAGEMSASLSMLRHKQLNTREGILSMAPFFRKIKRQIKLFVCGLSCRGC